jgi:hypothetical protein
MEIILLMTLLHCNGSFLCSEATRLPMALLQKQGQLAPTQLALNPSLDTQRLALYQRFEWVDLLEGDCPVCQQRIYFWQAGGNRMKTGPLFRIQKPRRIQQWLKWKKDWIASQKGADWVWGSGHAFPYRLQRKQLF